MSSARRSRALRLTVAALASAAVLGACTGDSEGDGTQTETEGQNESGSGEGSAPTGEDRSDAVLGYALPDSVASSSGKYGNDFSEEATLHVASVRATETSTVLTWWLEGEEHKGEILPRRDEPYRWPTLTDTDAKKVYEVDTWKDPAEGSGLYGCICTETRAIGPKGAARLMTAQYPPLPEGVSEVTVTPRYGQGYKPMKVPVER